MLRALEADTHIFEATQVWDFIDFATEHGAVGLFFRGIERDRTLDDPYFFPVYQEAARLNLPVCVHTGAGCPAFTAIFDVTRSPHLPAYPHPAPDGLPE
jgi:predicted TIM-barrel fold metal-dependent hydrolase